MLIKTLLTMIALLMSLSATAGGSLLQLAIEPRGADLIEVRLTNTSDAAVSVLRWGTPFESLLSNDVFSIYPADDQTANKLAYKGRYVARHKPLAEDFTRLKGGESIRQFVTLASYYDIVKSANYTVEYSGVFLVQRENNPLALSSPGQRQGQWQEQSQQYLSAVAQNVFLNESPATGAALAPAYYRCTDNQKAELGAVLQKSETLANTARDDLASLSDDERLNSPRYRQWFGQFSEARFSAVYDTFNRATNVLANEQVEFNCGCSGPACGCTESSAGFVYAAFPYKIYLCPLFWTLPADGVDSGAGLIIHELTHFDDPASNEISGTTDVVYGPQAAADLAVSDPDAAVTNADNYQYFAENTANIAISNRIFFTELVVGLVETNEINIGESAFYQVSGADFVELVSTNGDADLFVYETPTNDRELCRSDSINGYDRCDLPASKVAYIEIKSNMVSQFSIVAQALPPEPVVVETQGGSQTSSGGNGGGGVFCMWLFLLMVSGNVKRIKPFNQ